MIRERLVEVINEMCDYEYDKSTLETAKNLVDDLGFDSMQLVELIVNIENEFEISIDDDDLDIEKIALIDYLYNIICKQYEK